MSSKNLTFCYFLTFLDFDSLITAVKRHYDSINTGIQQSVEFPNVYWLVSPTTFTF